jgi:hypothetical protein
LALGPIAALERLLRLALEAARLLSLRVARLPLITWLIDRGWARPLPGALLGRIWIAVVAFALIGIVTLQLGLLKLNASIGRGLEREAILQRENAALTIENSEIAASARVESQAQAAGMELVPPGLLRFLSVRPGHDASQAAALLRQPFGTSSAGSAETPTSATPAQTGAMGSSEPSSAGSATTPSTAGPPGAQAPEAGTAAAPTKAPETEAAATSSPESTAGAGPQSASSPAGGQSVTAPGGGSSAEAPPAGGTQPAGAGG